MAPWNPLLLKSFWSLAALGGFYMVFISLLTIPYVGRNALYMHKIKGLWGLDVLYPEDFGFPEGQVTPFYLPTSDGEKLFAWHVLPMSVYAKNKAALLERPAGQAAEAGPNADHVRLLKEDPEARLVISFHGNLGTVGSGYRPDMIRSFLGISQKLHILKVDYRGFGLSSGEPNEAGLIKDGLAAVDWAMDVAKIPPNRIVLVGQSLGTAVVIATAESLARRNPPVEPAAIFTVAGFANLKSLLLNYKIGGLLPVLSPLRQYPSAQRFFSKFATETWESSQRIESLAKSSKNLNYVILHAKNDIEIPWMHSDNLFYAAANATSDKPLDPREFWAGQEKISMGRGGFRHVWVGKDGQRIQRIVTHWGGHNKVTTAGHLTLAVGQSLGLLDE